MVLFVGTLPLPLSSSPKCEIYFFPSAKTPIETELKEARKSNEMLQNQITQSHEREDQLRNELKSFKNQLNESLESAKNIQDDKQAKKELAAFKKELADVRAKQQFAVNEVKVLMAKLANKNENTSIGSNGDAVDFIDENLARLQSKKKKIAQPPKFVSRGNRRPRRSK